MASSKIATAYVQIAPSMDGVASEVKQYFGDAGNESGSHFGSNLVGKIKNLIVGAGLGKALSESLNAGAALQQSLGGVETLFKDSADTVIANAQNAYKTAGLSANEYMETVTSFSASLLQGLGGDTAAAADVADMALRDMSDNDNKFGTDMASIQNAYQGFAKQNYTMLDNLKLGYGGTKTEMERLLADAQELSGVEYNIDNLDDVYEAIHVIQEEMGVAGTTATEAASTFSGSLASMKAAASNVLGNLALGEDIGPSLSALSDTVFTFVTGNLLPMVGNVLQAIPDVISGAFGMAIQGLNLAADNADSILANGIGLVTALCGAIISALPQMAEAALNLVGSLAEGLLNNLPTAVESMGTILTDLLQAVLDAAPTILDNGIELIGSLSEGLNDNAPAVMESIGDILTNLIGMLADALPDLLSKGVELIGSMATGLLNNLPAVLSSIGSIIANLLATIASHLPDLLAQGISLIGQLAAGLIQAIPQVIAAIPQIITNIVNTFKGWNWGEIGSNIVSGIANGITAGAGAIWQAAKNAASNALKAAKNLLGIASPSKVMRDEVGKFIPAGIAVGIEANADDVTNAVGNLSDMTTAALQTDLLMDVPGTSMASSAATKTYGDMHMTINVYGAEGQDIRELAKLVMEEAQYEFDRMEAALA